MFSLGVTKVSKIISTLPTSINNNFHVANGPSKLVQLSTVRPSLRWLFFAPRHAAKGERMYRGRRDVTPDAPSKGGAIDPRYLPKRNEGNEQERKREKERQRKRWEAERTSACGIVCWITFIRVYSAAREAASLLWTLNTAHKRGTTRSGLNERRNWGMSQMQ